MEWLSLFVLSMVPVGLSLIIGKLDDIVKALNERNQIEREKEKP